MAEDTAVPAAPSPRACPPRAALSLGVALAAFSLYVCTLAPSVEIHDAGEIAAAAWTGGVMHPAGSPLYLILAKAFATALPAGSVVFRMNLFSALCGAAACGLLHALLRRLGAPALPSAAAALSLAFSAAFWFPALLAEVYTLNTLLLVAAFWGFLAWEEAPVRKRALAFAFLWGLLLANHMGLSPLTPLIWLAVCGRMAWREQEGWLPRAKCGALHFAAMSAVFLIPFSLYAALPIRSSAKPELDWGRTSESLENWLGHITARNVHERQFTLPAREYLSRSGEYASILLRQFTPVGFALALLGLWWLSGTAPWLAGLTLLTLLTDGFFVVFLDNAPIASEHYAVPGTLALALGLGGCTAGLARLAPRLRGEGGAAFLRPWEALMMALPALLVSMNYAQVNRRENFAIYDNVLEMLYATEPGSVLLLRDDNHVFPLAYMRAVEGRRRDLEAVDRNGNLLGRLLEKPLWAYGGEDERLALKKRMEEALFAQSLAQGRAVYATEKATEYRLDPSFAAVSWGPLARLVHAGKEPPGIVQLQFALRGASRTAHDWILGAVLMMRDINWGEHYWRIGRTEEALRRFEAAAAFESIPELQFQLGQIYLRIGQYGSARRAFEAALRAGPDFGLAWLQLGFTQGVMEDYPAALASLQRARELLPSLADPYEFEANIYERTGQPEKKAEALRTLLRLNPSDHRQRMRYARHLVELGFLTEAAQTLEAARPLPDVPMENLAALAEIYELMGQPQKALEAWREIERRGKFEWVEISQARIAELRKRWNLP